MKRTTRTRAVEGGGRRMKKEREERVKKTRQRRRERERDEDGIGKTETQTEGKERKEGGDGFGHTWPEEIFMGGPSTSCEHSAGTRGIFRSIPAHS